MARKIVVTSGKGGVGKTSMCASLGIKISITGKRVLLIDSDVGLNNLDVVMGVEDKIVYDMFDAITNKCTIKQALVSHPNISSLYVLPSQKAFAKESVSSATFKSILQKLDILFDFIIIDSPAGIGSGFHRAACGVDDAIVVTTPHISAIRDADKVISILNSYNLNSINVLVNRARGDLSFKGAMLSHNDISKILKKMIIGVVPEDDSITIYSQLGKMELNNTKSSKAIGYIAEYLINGKLQLYDPEKKYKNFFYRLIKGGS